MSHSKVHDSFQVGFIKIILLVGFTRSHRTGLVKAERISISVISITLTMMIVVAYFRVTHKLIGMGRVPSPDMHAVANMSGLQFEKYVARLLSVEGFCHIRLTKKYDYGVDIIAEKNGERWGIQCKWYSGLVKADAVRQVVTALNMYGCDRAMVITNSIYSGVARKLARSIIVY